MHVGLHGASGAHDLPDRRRAARPARAGALGAGHALAISPRCSASPSPGGPRATPRCCAALLVAAVLLAPLAVAAESAAPAPIRARARVGAGYRARTSAATCGRCFEELNDTRRAPEPDRRLRAAGCWPTRFARRGDWRRPRGRWRRAWPTATADSRLAPRALLVAARRRRARETRPARRRCSIRLIDGYPDAAELPEALYLLGMTAEARGNPEAAAADLSRADRLLAPTSGYADGGERSPRRAAARSGTRIPTLSRPAAPRPRRAASPRRRAPGRRRRGGADRLRSAGPGPRGARAEAWWPTPPSGSAATTWRRAPSELAVSRAPAERKPGLQLEQARLLLRAGQKDAERTAALDLLAGWPRRRGGGGGRSAVSARRARWKSCGRDAESERRPTAPSRARFPDP